MKTLQITDLQLVQTYLDKANYKGYNSNFITMMMWNHEYHILYEIVDDALIMLLEFDGHHFFSMPFCKPDHICKSVDWMLQYSIDNKIPFSLECVVQEVRDILVAHYGDTFMYLCNEDFSDYVYDLQTLVTLSGKKMQKRRNHYNAFCKQYPSIVYKEIEDEDIEHVFDCLKRWTNDQEYHELIDSEHIGISYLLNNRHFLPIYTGCIYINGILEAFTIASILPHKTVQIHVEKANKDIRGLYVAIHKLFLEHNFGDYAYVNREEDMGLESLRKAKKAMHPIEMIKKYSIRINNYKIQEATDDYLDQIKELWSESFEEEDEISANYYFNHHYPLNHCYIMLSNTEVVSMVSISPFQLENTIIHYIVGVATKNKHKRNHCMTNLLEYVMNLDMYKESSFCLLSETPEVYKKLGFKPTYFMNYECITQTNNSESSLLIRDASDLQLLNLYNRYTKQFSGFRLRDISYYQLLRKRVVAYNQSLQCIYKDDLLIGYIIISLEEVPTIDEFIFLESYYFNEIIDFISIQYPKFYVYSDILHSYSSASKLVPTMYVNKILNSNENPLFIKEIM